MRNYEQLAAQKNTRVSASRAAEYIRNFLDGETLPTADDEYALHQRFLPTVTLDEVNKIAKEWFSDANRLVIVSAPDKPGSSCRIRPGWRPCSQPPRARP